MKLELQIDGENKIFTTPFVSGRHFRKVMEYDEQIDYSDVNVEQTDELVGFVCDVFDNQFTVDQFYDGIPSHKVISTVSDVFIYVRTGKTPEELESESGNESGKQ